MRMHSANELAAELLEAGAAGYASAATDALLAQHSEIGTRYGAGARALWKAHFQQRVQELAAATRADVPALFVARVRWLQKAYAAQQVPPSDQHLALAALRAALNAELPEHLRACVEPSFEQAEAALETRASMDDCMLDPADPAGRLALQCLVDCLDGQPQRAINRVVGAADAGWALAGLYLDVLLPTQKEIGRMWHAGEASVAEERVVSDATRRAMALLGNRAPAPAPAENARTMLAASVAGNAHDLPLRAAADLFQFAGWRALCLGADVPAADIAQAVDYFKADLLVLAATLTTQLKPLERSIAAVRAIADQRVKILVGGQVFGEAPEIWQRLGADACAGSLADVVAAGDALVPPR
jgi:methanogenic corrinoid protein MtbC1